MADQQDQIIYPESTIVVTQTVKEIIDQIQGNISDAGKAELLSMGQAESQQAAQAYEQTERLKFELAKAQKDELAAKRAQAGASLKEGEQELADQLVNPGEPFKGTIFMLSFVACFVAEFVLTWLTLPFILSIQRYSFAGLMLAAAPTTALIILDVVLARLIEEPWQQLRAATTRLRKCLSWCVMAIFLLTLGALNAYTIAQLAAAREEAMEAKRQLERIEGDGQVNVDTQALNRAVLAVSICVAVDGALFLLIGLGEWKRRQQRLLRQARVADLQAENEQLTEQFIQATAKVNALERIQETLTDKAADVAAHYRHRLQFHLEQFLNRPPQPIPVAQLVEEILANGLKSQAGQSNLHSVKTIKSAAA